MNDGEMFAMLERSRGCTPWGNNNACGEPATYIIGRPCCGVEIPLCTSHTLEGTLELLALHPDQEYQCYACMTTRARLWDANLTIEEIK